MARPAASWLQLFSMGLVMITVSSSVPSTGVFRSPKYPDGQLGLNLQLVSTGLIVRLRGGKGSKGTSNESKTVDPPKITPPAIVPIPDPEEDPEVAQDQEDETCRFSYLKRAEREMRIAEERAAKREQEHQEHLEKKRRGEVETPSEEVKDTLRWGNPADKRSRKGRKAGKSQPPRAPAPPPPGSRHVADTRKQLDDVLVMARGAPGEQNARRLPRLPADEEEEDDEFDDDEEDSVELAEDELKRIEEEERQFEIKRVDAWLNELKMGQYLELFLQEGWDTLDDILNMTQEDLLALGLKRGHVRRLLTAMGRDMTASLARSSIARDVSYPREYSSRASRARGSRARHRADDDDIDIKPWSRDSAPRNYPPQRHDDPYERPYRRDTRDGSGMHTSVRTTQGPGGSSRLAEAGGLGAFLMGVSPEEEEMEQKHRRLQRQKEQIQDKLERERRQFQESHYGHSRRYR